MSSWKSKKKDSKGLADTTLAEQILALPPDKVQELKRLIVSTADRDSQQAAKAAVQPGHYYDPTSGKTFRLRRPVRRPPVYQEAETLEKEALRRLRAFCKEQNLVYDRTTKAAKMADGKDVPSDVKKKLDGLVTDYQHAKATFKFARRELGVHRTTAPKAGSHTDPSVRPALVKGKDGKPSWADIVAGE